MYLYNEQQSILYQLIYKQVNQKMILQDRKSHKKNSQLDFKMKLQASRLLTKDIHETFLNATNNHHDTNYSNNRISMKPDKQISSYKTTRLRKLNGKFLSVKPSPLFVINHKNFVISSQAKSLLILTLLLIKILLGT